MEEGGDSCSAWMVLRLNTLRYLSGIADLVLGGGTCVGPSRFGVHHLEIQSRNFRRGLTSKILCFFIYDNIPIYNQVFIHTIVVLENCLSIY